VRARDNPFAVQRVLEMRYRLSGVTWEELEGRLEALRFRAALVGPHGHGKTTLLEDLGVRLAGRGFRVRAVTLRAGESRLGPARTAALFRDPGPRDLLLVDGAEQLDRLAWWSLRRRSQDAAGLIVTSHQPGLLPTLHECRTTPDLLADLARALAPEAMAGEPAADELYARHGGNLRDALRDLYDFYAGIKYAGITSPAAARRGSRSPAAR
jgi:hypothetical protein